MFSKILIANRGEIAVRIARTCHDLGVTCVAVHSDVDAGARHVRVAHEAVALHGIAPAETYLDAEAIIASALESGAEAIHPGYGFLSEQDEFADAVTSAGLAWIGPPPDALRLIGDKISARKIARTAGVPMVPGLLDAVTTHEEVVSFADEHGYPVAIKAAGGGGGRGLKVARSRDEVGAALESATREAEAYFGDRSVYVERYLPAPKHMEVQVLAPRPDHALWLGVRDCSFQRRHQKLLEETPPPRHQAIVHEMGAAAVAMSNACGYVGAGTAEFLVDDDGRFYFLEVNARLQVEHTVTEEVYGIDLVAAQLRIAAGDELGFDQVDLVPRGHAIECRINAEDPARGFLPTPGALHRFVEPNGFGVRVDAGYAAGDEVPAAYDSLIAKVITWGNDRDEARARMLRALSEMVVEGVATTVPAHELLLSSPAFLAGSHTTVTIDAERLLERLITGADAPADTRGARDVLLVAGRQVSLWNPAMAPSAAAAVHGARASGELVAPMAGTILKVLVGEGQEVDPGAPVFILEAMKMETTITAPRPGKIAQLRAGPGATVGSGEVLAIVE